MDGWTKPAGGTKYAGLKSEKTFRELLKNGLKHSRLPSGRILIKYSDIDAYLERFSVSENAIDKAVDEILADF